MAGDDGRRLPLISEQVDCRRWSGPPWPEPSCAAGTGAIGASASDHHPCWPVATMAGAGLQTVLFGIGLGGDTAPRPRHRTTPLELPAWWKCWHVQIRIFLVDQLAEGGALFRVQRPHRQSSEEARLQLGEVFHPVVCGRGYSSWSSSTRAVIGPHTGHHRLGKAARPPWPPGPPRAAAITIPDFRPVPRA